MVGKDRNSPRSIGIKADSSIISYIYRSKEKDISNGTRKNSVRDGANTVDTVMLDSDC
jgi:hypothetical protein